MVVLTVQKVGGDCAGFKDGKSCRWYGGLDGG